MPGSVTAENQVSVVDPLIVFLLSKIDGSNSRTAFTAPSVFAWSPCCVHDARDVCARRRRCTNTRAGAGAIPCPSVLCEMTTALLRRDQRPAFPGKGGIWRSEAVYYRELTSWSHHRNRKHCTSSAAHSDRCGCVEKPKMCGLACLSANWQAWRAVPRLISGYFFGAGTNNRTTLPVVRHANPERCAAWQRMGLECRGESQFPSG